jgi:hypothetical protein
MVSFNQAFQSILDQFYRCGDIGEIDAATEPILASNEFASYRELVAALPSAIPLPKNGTGTWKVETDRGNHAVSIAPDPFTLIENLLHERYVAGAQQRNSLVRRIYYLLRPVMNTFIRKHLQRLFLRGWDRIPFPKWPVDRTVDRIYEVLLAAAMKANGLDEVPFVWFWPGGYMACATVTHDIETAIGRDFCSTLMDIDDAFGIKSAFQVVPEKRYKVTATFLSSIRDRGFEINVHDLNHDGNLFVEHSQFLERAKKINQYGKQFGAQGFRSAILYRKIEWMDALDFGYDMSIPNVAHLDPQKGGCCTVMPYFIGERLEIPVTAIQDYFLFHILNDYSTRLWEEQLKIITEAHGLASFIVHPDYVIEKRARATYEKLLKYLGLLQDQKGVWVALPGEINDWWRSRAKMWVRKVGDTWRVEGEGSERARVGFASWENEQLHYTFSELPST